MKEYTAHTFALPDTIPGLSAPLIKTHLGLYEGYVKHVNLLMQQMNECARQGETFAYAFSELRRRLGFEWNGMRLHELYFGALEHGSTDLLGDTALYKKLSEQYGGFGKWLEIFSKVSARGPGWALLTYDKQSDQFFHVWVADHEVGQLATLPVIIALDHWEHAFMPDYTPSEKGSYVEAYLSALNWETVSKRFDEALQS